MQSLEQYFSKRVDELYPGYFYEYIRISDKTVHRVTHSHTGISRSFKFDLDLKWFQDTHGLSGADEMLHIMVNSILENTGSDEITRASKRVQHSDVDNFEDLKKIDKLY